MSQPKTNRTAPNPSGLCMCGCGQTTSIAKNSDRSGKFLYGEHRRYVAGHQRRLVGRTPLNPTGLCQCGCGETTNRAKSSDTSRGILRGEHFRFISGHEHRRPTFTYAVEDRGYTTPCWIWQRYCNKEGYGIATPIGGRRVAHVLMWESVNGPVPEGLQLDHLCRVRPCINPDHLEPVTAAVNMQRAPHAKLTPELVREIRRLSETMGSPTLARKFGVSQHTIWRVVNRVGWKNID